MKKTIILLTVIAAIAISFTGCSRRDTPAETPAPAVTPAPVGTAAPAAPDEPAAEPERQDGERYEAVIMVEGMEETVRYEHVLNDALGFQMGYDYERFLRRSEPDRECFISIWDDPQNPENYLEVTYSPEDADAVAASVRAALSTEYELLVGTRELEGAGSCLRIEASVIKGTNNMADQLQAVYIIPAPDGCRVAAAHYAVEAAEGFGRRFSYMLNTLAVTDRSADGKLSAEQTLAAVKKYCFAANPDLESIVQAGEYPVYWEIASASGQEIVVLFRSYTGAQLRYYIDPVTGDTTVTEFVPGVTAEEAPTGESFNAWDYLD